MDDLWTTDHTAPQESDDLGNINNVLLPKDITKSHSSSTVHNPAIMSNITPQSTTAELAGKVPKVSSREPDSGPDSSSALPGSFPETPANELPSFSVNPLPATAGIGNPINLQAGEKVPDPSTLTSNTISSTIRDDPDLVEASKDSHGHGKNSEKSVSINPIPATAGIGNPIQLEAGENVPDPTTLTSNTISSTVRDDPDLAEAARDSEKLFSVKPLPATSGIGNPIQLRPGDTLPDPTSYTRNTIQSNVTLDKGSYDKNSSVFQLPNVVTPQQERDAAGRGIFDVPPVTGATIPESSLPIGSGPSLEQDPGVTIQSAAPKSSTAALAGQVPLEPRSVPRSSEVPDVTIQSAGPNSTTADLAGKVPLEPKKQTKGSEPPDVTIQSVGPNSTTADLAGQVPFEARRVPRSSEVPDVTTQSAGPNSTTADLAGKVPLEPKNETKAKEAPDVTVQTVGPNSTSANLAGQVPLEPHVPHIVKESQQKAGFAPEASANSEAIREKAEVEQELENKVPEEPAAVEGSSSSKEAKDITIQSVGPNSTTAVLAGQVPLEPKSQSKAVKSSDEAFDATIQSVDSHSTTAGLAGQVPQVVEGSQQKAGVSPEASAGEKAAVEKGLENKLPKEHPASEGIGSPGSSDDVTIQSVGPNSTTAALAGQVSPEHRHVPEIVQYSQDEAGFPPEASANEEAVSEKAAVEKELESKVSEEPATSEGVGGQSTEGNRALTSTKQPEEKTISSPSHALPSSVQQSIDEINSGAGVATVTPIAPSVPHIVQESIAESHESPEAAANKIQVDEKYQVEQQLLKEVKTEDALGEPAPSASAALTDHAPAATNDTLRSPATLETQPTDRLQSGRHDSRDVSPMSHPINPDVSQPRVTTGAASSTVPETSAPPSTPKQDPVPSSSSSKSPSTPTDKKSKRASGFFGRLKNKFHHSDKKSTS